MIRSKWKGDYVDASVIKQFDRINFISSVVWRLYETKSRKNLREKVLKLPWDLPKLPKGKVRQSSATVENRLLEMKSKAFVEECKNRTDLLHVWSMRTTIISEFVGISCSLYCGNKMMSFSVERDMIGKKFGEFCFNKKMGQNIHYVNKKKKKTKQKNKVVKTTNKSKNIQKQKSQKKVGKAKKK